MEFDGCLRCLPLLFLSFSKKLAEIIKHSKNNSRFLRYEVTDRI